MATLSKYQFSLKALMVATLCAALVVAAFPFAGHYLIFGTAALVPFVCVSKLVRRGTTLVNRSGWLVSLAFSMLVAFTLSIGPASWFLSRYNTPDHPRPRTCAAYHRAYQPIATFIIYSPPLLRRPGMWYIANGMPRGTHFHDDWPTGMGWTTMSPSDPSKGLTFTVVSY